MAKQQSAVRNHAFDDVDELAKDITKLAYIVNARFVVDSTKVRELRAPKVSVTQPTKKRLPKS
jgi:hypothetical protein